MAEAYEDIFLRAGQRIFARVCIQRRIKGAARATKHIILQKQSFSRKRREPNCIARRYARPQGSRLLDEENIGELDAVFPALCNMPSCLSSIGPPTEAVAAAGHVVRHEPLAVTMFEQKRTP